MTTTSSSIALLRPALAAVAALAVLPLAVSPAHAQSADDLQQLLKQADANRDGDLTWTEVVELRTKSFGRMDRNGDGYIDKSDRPSIFGGRFDSAMAKVARFDANGDGRISSQEMIEAEAPVFTKGDTNGDQVLTAEEIQALRATL